MAVISENEAILASFEGSWASPKLPGDWLKDPELRKRQRVAGIQFRRSYPNEPWACKDPRMSLTLPYWDTVLGRKQPVVMVVRNPLEIVESLRRREPERRHTSSYYLSLWERYSRAALENFKSRPVFIVNYEDLLSDWEGIRKSLRAWLNEAGIQTGLDSSSPINKTHRHQNAAKSLDGLSEEQMKLYDVLQTIRGAYQNFVPPEFGPETGHTKTLFGGSNAQQEAGFSNLVASWPKFRLNIDWSSVKRYVTSGIVAAAVLSLISAAIMYWSTTGVTETFDDRILGAVSGIHVPLLAWLMQVMTNLSAKLTIDIIAIGAAIVLAARKKMLEALVLLLALLAENLIVLVFQAPAAVPLDNFAGRVFRMVVIFGLLGYITYKSVRSASVRVQATLIYLILIGLTCASRVYESARYPSSVLAAAFLGAAVLVTIISIYEGFKHSSHRSAAIR